MCLYSLLFQKEALFQASSPWIGPAWRLHFSENGGCPVFPDDVNVPVTLPETNIAMENPQF